MDNEFFLNTGLQQPPVHFEPPSTSPATIFNWPSMSSSSTEIQPPELNLGRNPANDCFFWEKSTEQSIFASALSSLVSSPTASNSNFSGAGGGGDSFFIRELIGKLGNVGNRPGEIYGTPAINNGKGYATQMSSPQPPKLNIPMMAAAVKPTPLADFSADPGFAERAARFSCFGSRSFNGRNPSAQFAVNNGNLVNGSAATTIGSNGKLARVSSSPSFKALAPQMCNNDLSPKQHSNFNEESTVSGQETPGAGDSYPKNAGDLSRKRKSVPKGKSKENSPSTASTSPNSLKGSEGNEESDPKRSKVSEENEKKEEGSAKTTEEEGGGKGNKTKPAEPPKDYIHVRARRGQATDSHSLAERVRREKISERMKLLQDLVPGCNKVTGKALMLDEIINYVQSLQRQVEFLSMKLASVNTRLDFNVDALLSKDIIQQSHHPMHQQPCFAHNQPQQHNNVTLHPNGTIPQSPLDPIDTSTLSRSFNTHLPTRTQFTDPIPQYPTFCEDDLHSIVQMGFTQNLVRESETIQSQPQLFQGSNQASHMKIEI